MSDESFADRTMRESVQAMEVKLDLERAVKLRYLAREFVERARLGEACDEYRAAVDKFSATGTIADRAALGTIAETIVDELIRICAWEDE